MSVPTQPVPRPPSILWFERLYLASLVIYLYSVLAHWDLAREAMLDQPSIRSVPQLMKAVPAIMGGSLAATVIGSLLFWWLTARRASVVGKWLVVVSQVIGAGFALWGLSQVLGGTAPFGAVAALGQLSSIMALVAAAMLFRPDARAWLGEGVVAAEPWA